MRRLLGAGLEVHVEVVELQVEAQGFAVDVVHHLVDRVAERDEPVAGGGSRLSERLSQTSLV